MSLWGVLPLIANICRTNTHRGHAEPYPLSANPKTNPTVGPIARPNITASDIGLMSGSSTLADARKVPIPIASPDTIAVKRQSASVAERSRFSTRDGLAAIARLPGTLSRPNMAIAPRPIAVPKGKATTVWLVSSWVSTVIAPPVTRPLIAPLRGLQRIEREG
jgi:hypothetical protein